MKLLKILSTIFLGLAGLIGVIFLAAYLHLIPQFKALMVLSGSMEPTLKTGGVAVVVPSKRYLPGNIISFYQDANKKNVVTHRVLFKLYPDGAAGKPLYLTGGDANKNVDQVKIKEDQIIGKLLFSIPYLGYFANFVKTPAGFILLIIVPATIIVYEELRRVKKELQEGYQKHKEKKALANFYYQLHFHSNLPEAENGLNRLLILIPVFFAAIIVTSLSVSFFSDRETTLGNSFQAGIWITPTPPTPTPPSNLADHIVISEVQIKGSNAKQDFVELYNPTNNNIDLSGWKIRKKIVNGTESSLVLINNGKSITSHGFFLWANSEDEYGASIGADESNTNNLSENNSVALENPQDLIIDQVAWGNGHSNPFVEGTAFPQSPATNQSIERKAYSTSDSTSMMSGSDVTKGNAYDSENNTNDFILRTTSQPQNTSSATESP